MMMQNRGKKIAKLIIGGMGDRSESYGTPSAPKEHPKPTKMAEYDDDMEKIDPLHHAAKSVMSAIEAGSAAGFADAMRETVRLCMSDSSDKVGPGSDPKAAFDDSEHLLPGN